MVMSTLTPTTECGEKQEVSTVEAHAEGINFFQV